MTRQLIEFQSKPQMLEVFPRPYPASRAIPDWFRQMPTQSAPEVPTVKRCPPFLEAMTAGYIIPVPADIKIIRTETELKAEMAQFTFPLVDMHMQGQFPGAPMGNSPLLKFISPWLITTPAGYSTLFLAPLNRFESPIVPLSGIVETDTYYRGVAFPAICMLSPGQQVILERGAPLVQVIPILREQWSAGYSGWDEQRMNEQDEVLTANPQMYKDEHWKKKSYA